MSRIGKQAIAIPPKVKVEVKGQQVFVEGPKGKLNWELPRRTGLKVDSGKILVSRSGDDAEAKALEGTGEGKRLKAIGDGEALEAILRALGYEPVLRMEKVRAVWEREELEACLDETPFGCYLELEGDPQAIRAAMEGLGLAPDRAEPRSYPELYQAHGLG